MPFSQLSVHVYTASISSVERRARPMTPPSRSRRLLAIEGGGTTWVASVVELGPGESVEDPTGEVDVRSRARATRAEFATTTPRETLATIREWIEANAREVDAIGVATFGPVDVRVDRDTYGYITTTPKPGWANTDVLGGLFGEEGDDAWRSHARLKTRGGIPIGFDTDVNAPAMAEYARFRRQSDEPEKTSCCYVTVGTGVGVGIVVNGLPVHGILHPEAGHVHVKSLEGDDFPGTCPFHGNCVEGMVSSGALAKRRQVDPRDLVSLPDDDPVWDACAHYLAGLCVTLSLTLSPERIVLGGGVMQRSCLFPKVRERIPQLLAGYMSLDELVTKDGLANYVVPSDCGNDAGLIGAFFLADFALCK